MTYLGELFLLWFHIFSIWNHVKCQHLKATMKNNPRRLTQVIFKVVIHYPGSLFVMSTAFKAESLCSRLAMLSSPRPWASCVSHFSCCSWAQLCRLEQSWTGLHQQRFQSAVVPVPPVLSSERLCASTLSSCFCHQPRVADAWARRQELTHF